MNQRITRRQFFHRTAASAAFLTSTLQPTTYAQRASVPTIGTHTHFYDPTRPQGVPWPPKTETRLYKPHLPPQFRSLTSPHNVVGTVVVEASPWVEDNQWVLDLATKDQIIVGFIGNLKPGQREFPVQLRRFSLNPLFRGLRVSEQVLAEGIERREFQNDVRKLGDQELTLDLLGGAAMLPNAARVAKLAPKLNVVIDHLPFEVWDKDAAEARRALSELAALPNVYAKVSAVVRRVNGQVVDDAAFYRPGLDLLTEMFGSDRVIYGSNWPVSERVAPYATVYKVVADYFNAKGAAAAKKFFWKNSLAAYRWQPRGLAKGLAK